MSTLWNRPHIWFAIHLLSFTVFIERLSLAYAFLASLSSGSGFMHLGLVYVQILQPDVRMMGFTTI